ncbi:GNAT family N-acetyltransferase [Roseomonas sp. CAU 1739]|uniref:GNAT family N-acetyltransferase n=1 Tax=Roseomonas sp. CAU 1739 TaxID=3140364 RepID=UPI00325B7494
MTAAVSVRAGVAADAPLLARLFLAARAAAMPGLREAHDAAQVAGWLATHLMTQHTVRVAMLADRPVGYIGFGRDGVHGPMILHLYLDPAAHRRGIGSRLLAEATAALGPRLSLFCIARNTGARAFYEHHGFRAAAISDGATTEEGEPDILYVRDAGAPDTDTTTSGSTP